MIRSSAKNFHAVTVVTDPEDYPSIIQELAEKEGITLETRHRRKDGTTHPVEISVVQTAYGEREHHTAFARDIRQRKADEAMLRRDP
jgi:PAS domain S-box-containing protein